MWFESVKNVTNANTTDPGHPCHEYESTIQGIPLISKYNVVRLDAAIISTVTTYIQYLVFALHAVHNTKPDSANPQVPFFFSRVYNTLPFCMTCRYMRTRSRSPHIIGIQQLHGTLLLIGCQGMTHRQSQVLQPEPRDHAICGQFSPSGLCPRI